MSNVLYEQDSQFLSDQSLIIVLPCQSLSQSMLVVRLDWCDSDFAHELSQFYHGIVIVFHGFVKIDKAKFVFNLHSLIGSRNSTKFKDSIHWVRRALT